MSSYLSNAQEKEDFEKKASTKENNATEQKLVEGWRCSSFTGMQKSTQYVVWDCYRIVADCGVKVRIAWPHLPKNPPDYDRQMESVLSDFLTSVAPSGPLQPTSKSGVLRRNEEPPLTVVGDKSQFHLLIERWPLECVIAALAIHEAGTQASRMHRAPALIKPHENMG